ncbi:hypothetical protein KKA23_00155 [Patescibacteria group bacterium]|nr:hypothetical protein [Patescibacteria group bacterium]MBU3922965.1 hypothetical protein [Patescibacteria group bacterium]
MIILIFWKWYYTKGVKNILFAWKNFILFSVEYFSIPLLLKTLFSPWKRDITKKPRGLDLKKIFEYISFNTISRGLGFVIRFFTILVGILFFLLTLIIGCFIFIIWLILPLIFIGLLILAFFLIV